MRLAHGCAAWALLLLAGWAAADESWLNFRGKVEADPNKVYWLSAGDGAYVIYVASFRGDSAEEMARNLVQELRADFKLPAFMLKRVDEEAQAERERLRKLQEERGQTSRAVKVRVFEDYAVLIGGFKSEEAARKALPELKKRQAPKTLPHVRLQIWTDPLSARREGRHEPAKPLEEGRVSPFGHAFVTRNPLTTRLNPVEVQQVAAANQALGAAEKFSIFNNKKPYTLVVMVFRAPAQLQQERPSVFDLNAGFFGTRTRTTQSPWQNANWLADRLAHQLQDGGKGYETYLLHTSEATLVTVGGFSGPADPALKEAQQRLARLNVGGIQLLDMPYPMQVPNAR
ncbi:MAG TPA: SPOR domain-containing protein [Gemmatales bacterium]|nr:SPOR domain-containing protein [Gemmatales bacterium]HMP58196.1 SPOR domain-containing protein [Gemmatales bacterium]